MSKIIDMDELTAVEKILLVEELWDDIAARHPDDVPVTPAQQQDLRQRLAYIEQHPAARVTWEKARQELGKPAR